MPANGLEQGIYVLLSLVSAFVILVLFISVLIFAVCLYIIGAKCGNRCKRAEQAAMFFRHDFPHLLARVAMRGLVKDASSTPRNESPENVAPENNSPKSFIHDRPAPDRIIKWLAAYAILVSFFALEIFWDVFLLEVSHTCDPGLDCYRDDDDAFHANPVQNCSGYEEGNVTFTCYAFVFNFGTAAGVAGGLFTIMSGVFEIIGRLFLYLYDKTDGKWHTRIMYIQKIMTVVASLIIIVVSILIMWFLEVIDKLTFVNVYQTFIFLLTVIVALRTPWWLLNKPSSETALTELV